MRQTVLVEYNAGVGDLDCTCQRNPFLLGHNPEIPKQMLQPAADLQSDRRQIEGAGLDFGDVQHVADRAEQAFAGAPGSLDVIFQTFIVLLRQVLPDQIYIPGYYVKRRADLMTRVCYEG